MNWLLTRRRLRCRPCREFGGNFHNEEDDVDDADESKAEKAEADEDSGKVEV